MEAVVVVQGRFLCGCSDSSSAVRLDYMVVRAVREPFVFGPP
ncbi:22118_t:CDS:2 [Gigaspora margarita]|uniref:22118_t:CDS:1 n=1 Tax=Gigaspora margarita TaxID=4874 RepID=A0ABN7V677_GIGMA|nr:22118_t:CDS:2 [Gigaspora margarita]